MISLTALPENGYPAKRPAQVFEGLAVIRTCTCLLLFVSPLVAEGPPLMAPDKLKVTAPKEKATAVPAEGKVGKAIRFAFEKEARSTFCITNIRGGPEWDKAAGFSFLVQGDGSDALGGLEFIYDNDFAVRYDFAFPIKNKDWSRVTVAWEDLIPVLPGAKNRPLGKDGNLPSKLSALWFGKWWYWGEYPACSYTIDDLRLEPTIARDSPDHRPQGTPLKRTLQKFEARQPITMVTMGDSLTDFKHWTNRKTNWVQIFKDKVKEKYGTDVTIVNPAIGGTQLRQNLVLIPRWLDKAPAPDLVTIAFGYNDWDAGMRGEEFHRSYLDAVDRVRGKTRGKADVLIITTAPAVKRWETMTELADACRRAAKEKSAGLADTEKAFLQAGMENRERLFADGVHLTPEGHALVADTVLKSIESAAK